MAFSIPIHATGFKAPFPYLPQGHLVQKFLNRDLIRAAIITGHPFGSGTLPDPLIRAWRISTIKLAVQHTHAGWLNHPRAWGLLDPTEKGQIRNMLGNTITKLLCERLLNAPLLVFLDVYGQQYGSHYTGNRPDFLAQTICGSWFVVEAKGRDRMAGMTKLTKIKTQQAQATAAAQPGVVAAHVVSWIGAQGDRLSARFHDPEPDPERRMPPLEVEKLVECYYAPVLSILRESATEHGSLPERPVEVRGADVSLELHPHLSWALNRGDYEKAWHVLNRANAGGPIDSEFAGKGYGPDGIRIEPGETWPNEKTP
jgi:hypothetical protein